MIFKEYPILYLDIDKQKKRFWKIWIEISKEPNNIYLLCREYGIIGGKITIPNPIELVDEKKIITKANALFKKKKESGFYELEQHLEKKNKMEIKTKQSIIKPMGAHKLDDHYHKLKYPVCVQKKLDGYRCLSHYNKALASDKKIELLSKNMKSFLHLPHIKDELNKIKEMYNGELYLDGELYEKGLKLHNIGSIVRKQFVNNENIERMKKVSYYIFDCFQINKMNLTFKERFEYLKKNIFDKYSFQYIKLVDCVTLNNYEEVLKENEKYLMEGYEGVIVRNLDGLYKWNKKSYDVLRTKEFKKGIFEIVGAKEGQGAQKGSVVWQCKCLKNNNKTFWVIPIGSIEERRKQWKEYGKNGKKYIGRKVKVKYLDIDKEGCVTRNPILEEWID